MFLWWFAMAAWLTVPLRLLLNALMPELYPNAITAIEQDGYALDVVTTFAPPPAPGIVIPEGMIGTMVIQVNPLIFGYGIPLFTALLLASPGTEKEKWLKWISGMLILFVIQAWGVFFNILKVLLFGFGPEIQARFGFSDLALEGVAFAYQFGYLILPAVSPVVLWLGFHQRFIVSLVPNLAARS